MRATLVPGNLLATPHISVEFLNLGGWLSNGDLALESHAHFLATAEHRWVPSQSQWCTTPSLYFLCLCPDVNLALESSYFGYVLFFKVLSSGSCVVLPVGNGAFSLLSMVTKVRETTLTDVLTDELLSSGLCAVLANLSWCEILMLIL